MKARREEPGSKPRSSWRRKIVVLLMGMMFCLVFLEIALRIGGFAYRQVQDHQNEQAVLERGTYRILCVGESTTAMGGEFSYPRQLEQLLNEGAEDQRFAVINKGVLGVDTSVLLQQLEDNLDEYQPQIVVAMMGGNDVGGAIPEGFSTLEGEGGFFTGLKTVRLARLLWFNLTREDETDAPQPRPPRLGDGGARPNWGGSPHLDALGVAPHPPPPPAGPPAGSSKDEGPGPDAEAEGAQVKEDPIDIGYPFNEAGMRAMDGDPAGAEMLLEAAVRDAPANRAAYVNYGRFLSEQGRWRQATAMFEEAIELDPLWAQAWIGLANNRSAQGHARRAEEAFGRAIAVDPESVMAHMEMASFLAELERCDEAVERFRAAIRLRPTTSEAYWRAADCLVTIGRSTEAEELLVQILERRASCLSYTRFIDLLDGQDRHEEIVGVLSEGLERYPKDACLADLAGRYFVEHGEPERARRVYESALYYHPKTRHNFLRMQSILADRGIKLVVVQYPGRALEPLRALFTTTAGVSFVDNEATFREALETMEYADLFLDNCYKDFGHATPVGNRMLAANIAEVILAGLD